MKTGQTLRKPPQMAPRRASVSDLAASIRCTMYWSVHQYQTPMIGEAIMTPSHGNVGSESGRHSENRSTFCAATACSSPHPPSRSSPKMVMNSEPRSSSPVWSTSVYTTARSPPRTV